MAVGKRLWHGVGVIPLWQGQRTKGGRVHAALLRNSDSVAIPMLFLGGAGLQAQHA